MGIIIPGKTGPACDKTAEARILSQWAAVHTNSNTEEPTIHATHNTPPYNRNKTATEAKFTTTIMLNKTG